MSHVHVLSREKSTQKRFPSKQDTKWLPPETGGLTWCKTQGFSQRTIGGKSIRKKSRGRFDSSGAQHVRDVQGELTQPLGFPLVHL